jgi:hypothetical protein
MVEEGEAQRLHAELAAVLVRNGYARVLAEVVAPSGVDRDDPALLEGRPQARALLELVDAFGTTLVAGQDLPAATFDNLAGFDVRAIGFADPDTGEVTDTIRRDAVDDSPSRELLALVANLYEIVSSND